MQRINEYLRSLRNVRVISFDNWLIIRDSDSIPVFAVGELNGRYRIYYIGHNGQYHILKYYYTESEILQDLSRLTEKVLSKSKEIFLNRNYASEEVFDKYMKEFLSNSYSEFIDYAEN